MRPLGKDVWHIEERKADDLKENPRDFFKTFRPFLSTKGHKGDIEIHLRTDGDVVEKDQTGSQICSLITLPQLLTVLGVRKANKIHRRTFKIIQV